MSQGLNSPTWSTPDTATLPGSADLHRLKMWERACSRRRTVSQHIHRLTDRFREQARSHRGPVLTAGYHLMRWWRLQGSADLHRLQMWERACPRRRTVSQHIHRLTHRFREQARSHRGPGVDCGISLDAVVEIARICRLHRLQRWERACPRRRTVSQQIHRLTHRFRGQARSHRGPGVDCGISFDAVAEIARVCRLHRLQRWERACPRRRTVSQQTHRLTHRFRGQARAHRGHGVDCGISLDAVVEIARTCRLHRLQMWERACSRRRRVSQHIHRLTYRFREQARSHKGARC
jgi:hypothetical protein